MLLYQIAITLIPGIGDINGKKLISYCGGVEAVFRESKANLLRIPGIGDTLVRSIMEKEVLMRAEEELKFIEKHGIRTLFFLESGYPERLKHCIDGPVMLYAKGGGDLNSSRVISIVGTRKVTEYGREVCRKLAEGLSPLNAMVVSGLAYGVDTCAHRAALENGLPTVGVLAHGLDRIYPSTNRSLAERMLEKGGLVTEFISRTIPDRENFPKRNRVIAGLSDAVVVVESAGKGGALITADIANSYDRDVFAVPGRWSDPFSEGCNFLVRTNRAALIQSAGDVITLMGWDDARRPSSGQTILPLDLSEDEKALIEVFKMHPEASLDFLKLNAGLTSMKAAVALLNLEFSGLVKCLPGNRYLFLH
ncbi:MAG: DNA-processing protein DprA [Bacteroidales bacterium]|nr:DNA-processing protein DprA [Bacteroidales bacterium]